MTSKVRIRSGFLLSMLLAAPVSLFPQGFSGGFGGGLGGLTKDKFLVKIHRKLPAVFVLPATEVGVKVTATAAGASALAASLTPLVETTIQHNDTRVVIENAKPQVAISCIITGYIAPRIENLVHPGTPAGKNPLTGKPTAAQPGKPYRKVTGELTVSYRAVDERNKKTLDAAVLDAKVSAEYEGTATTPSAIAPSSIKMPFGFHPPSFPKKATDDDKDQDQEAPATPEQVNQRMMAEIANDIARRAVTTDDTIEVMMARGKLEPAAKLAESGLWPRVLEQVESMTPFPQPEEDAYRLYDIGVAYEAMGYGAPDPTQGFKLFEQAAINYGKALDDNPREKYFREPQNRVQLALLIMKTMKDRAAGVPVSADNGTQVPVADPLPDADVLTNEGVIELAKSGMNDENLIANIKESKHVNFNLTVSGQKQLLQGGISNKVLGAMRDRSKAAEAQQR